MWKWLFDSVANTDVIADILAIMIAWILYKSDKNRRVIESRKNYLEIFNDRLHQSVEGNRNFTVNFVNQRAYFFGVKRFYTIFLNFLFFNQEAAEIQKVTDTGVIFVGIPVLINGNKIYTFGFLPFKWIIDVDFDGSQNSSVTHIYVKAPFFKFPFKRIYSYNENLFYIENNIKNIDILRIKMHNLKINLYHIFHF